jgi:predicted HAD superfamily phosphohydrolase
VDALLLLRRAVEARIEGWDHPVIEVRDEAAGEVGLMLQEVVRQQLAEAIPAYDSLDGVNELAAATSGGKRLYVLGAFYVLSGNRNVMLLVEADLDLTPGAASTVRVAGEASISEMPTSERQFVRRMENINWSHHLTLHLA